MFRPAFFLLQNHASWLLASDKIFSVMTIILLILTGLVVLLIRTERNLKQVEKQMNELDQLSKQVKNKP